MLGDDGRGVDDLLLHAEVVPDAGVGGDERLARLEVQPHRLVVHLGLLIEPDDDVHRVVAAVVCQSFWHDEKGIGKGLDAEGLAPLDSLGVLADLLMRDDFEGAGARNDTSIVNGVLDSAETIADGILDLAESKVLKIPNFSEIKNQKVNLPNGVAIRAADQEGDGGWLGAVLDKGELVLAQDGLVDQTSLAEN